MCLKGQIKGRIKRESTCKTLVSAFSLRFAIDGLNLWPPDSRFSIHFLLACRDGVSGW